MGANITEKNGEVFCKCDVIFLGVKPSLLSTAVTDTLNTLTKSVSCKDVVFISMLAGITISSLREVCLRIHISSKTFDAFICMVQYLFCMLLTIGIIIYWLHLVHQFKKFSL